MAGFSISQPGRVGQRIGGGLDAVSKAIEMYMQLRQQKRENTRADLGDQQRQQQIDIARQQQGLAERKFGEEQGTGEEKALQYLIGNFGGEEVQPAAQSLLQKHPEYWTATQRERTLPASGGTFEQGPPTAAGPSLGMPQRTDLPMAETGRTLFKTPQDARERIAYIQALSRSAEGDANRANRIDVTRMQITQRDRALAAAQGMNNARLAMQQRGMDLTDLRAVRVLDSLEQRFNAAQTNDEIADLMRISANPMILFGAAAAPAAPPVRQVGPAAGAPAAGSGRYTSIP